MVGPYLEKLCLCLEGIVFPNTDLPALTTNFFVAHAPRNLFGAILIFSARFCGFSTERSTPFCDIFWRGMKEYDKFTTISNSVDTRGVCWLFGWGYFNDQSANKTRKTRRIPLLLFFRDSRAGNRRRRIPAVCRIKLEFTEHAQQYAPLLANSANSSPLRFA